VTAAGETPARDPLAVLAEIRQREQAATPEPWSLEYELCDCGGENGFGHQDYPYAIRTSVPHILRVEGEAHLDGDYVHSEISELTFRDVEFIVAARTDMPRLLAIPEALLKLAAEFDRPASGPRDPNPVVAMEAMAFMHAAARIRSAIAAALTGEETTPS
jgi:hypothetical protein